MGVRLGLALREEHRVEVFEKWILSRIFRPKRDEMVGGWRKSKRNFVTCTVC
jgi:hypothetical protein